MTLTYEIYGFNIVNIIINTGIAIFISIVIGKLHEVFHIIRANQLHYQVVNFELWKNETEIGTCPVCNHVVVNENANVVGKCKWCKGPLYDQLPKDVEHKIGKFPYYFNFPIGIALIIIGWFSQPFYIWWGIIVAGVFIVFAHIITLPLEGRERVRSNI